MKRPPILFDDPHLTFSKLCAAWLLTLDERMQIKGFAKELCSAVRAQDRREAEDLGDLIRENRIIPDAYIIDREMRTAYVFEIEDTNPLSADKLRKLSSIWFRLDSIDWEMRVFLIDRYLTCWRSLPLADVWFSLRSPDPRLHGSERARQRRNVAFDWEATHLEASRSAINFPIMKREKRRAKSRAGGR